MNSRTIDIAALTAGDRAMLGRAITLVESRRPDHARLAARLVQDLLDLTGKAVRLGITGVPGVGKSTLIDALGMHLVGLGHRVAVLAVDPSSRRTGGSILGDKTRMARLAHDPAAFVRPSPSAGTLGGVAARTREAMLVCEAAGFDVVIVETVGIGQSEIAVADMTDTFAVLALPGAGDELQGIKKGVIEIADLIAVNKADGDNLTRAKTAAAEYLAALHIVAPRTDGWSTPVLTCSALTGDGIGSIWDAILDHRARAIANGAFADRRRSQQIRWLWSMVEERALGRLRADPAVRARLPAIEAEVAAGTLSAALAAENIATLAGL